MLILNVLLVFLVTIHQGVPFRTCILGLDAKISILTKDVVRSLPGDDVNFGYCGIDSIGEDAFRFNGSSLIRFLRLQTNKITTLDEGILDGLTKVESMNFDRNLIAQLIGSPFRNLSSLEYLSLQDNKIQRIESQNFKDLHNLRHLDLGKNLITHIDGFSFLHLPLLSELNLRYNRLTAIEEQLLSGLGSLTVLYFGNNLISRIDGQWSSTKSLTTLELSYNLLTILTSWTLKGLGSLRVLNLGNNKISIIKFDAFSSLHNLLRLDLRGNNITTFNGRQFLKFGDLEILTVMATELTVIEEDAFDPCTRLKEVALEIWSLTQTPRISAESLTISFHSIGDKGIVNQVAARLVVRLKDLKKSTHTISAKITKNIFTVGLDLSNNNFMQIEEGCFNFLAYTDMELLTFKRNNITRLSRKMFAGLSNLRSLTVNYNRLEIIEEGTFELLRSLRELLIDHNNLGRIDAMMFKGLSSPGFLYIAFNKIEEIEEDSFRDLTELVHLELTHNQLREIGENFLPRQNILNTLLINHNQLQKLPKSLLEDAMKSGSSISTLDLVNNPFHCNCDLFKFQSWLSANHGNMGFRYISKPACSTPRQYKNRDFFNVSLTCTNPSEPNVTFFVEGDDLTITCSSHGDPAPTVKLSSPQGNSIANPPRDKSQLLTVASLRLSLSNGASKQNGGQIQCEAGNVKGTVQETQETPFASVKSVLNDCFEIRIGLYVCLTCLGLSFLAAVGVAVLMKFRDNRFVSHVSS